MEKIMKVCVIQPAYSTDYSRSEEYFKNQINLIDKCDDSMDIIVLPESCDIPCLAATRGESLSAAKRFNEQILNKAKETAIRCNAIVFVNARSFDESERGRNTTYAIDRNGNVVGKYFKQHLTPGEVENIGLDSDYTFEYSAPTVIEIEGIKFAFLTCYDFYFYEAFPTIARQNVDVIIGCSHQRSDTHRAIEIISRFLAYNTNAYVIRASVSMDEHSDIGGGSMVVSPSGEVLLNLYSRIGVGAVEINVGEKYYKPAGFGNPPAAHYEYIERGRRPWKYRPAGGAIVRPDKLMPYPRTCAHRGFRTIAPENSMPAFGAAIAMGAEEIEFDLYFTKDGEIVSIHDSTLERVSDGFGNVKDYTLDELLKLDFGIKAGERFSGMQITTFEQILKKFACHCIMNIHIKTEGQERWHLDKLISLIRQYDCEKYAYIMSGRDATLERLAKEYPDIQRCCGGGDGKWEIVDRAIKYGCQRVQLYKPYFNEEMIKKAHEHGIVCNVFFSDDPAETETLLDMGIDVILTNDYHNIASVVNKREKYTL